MEPDYARRESFKEFARTVTIKLLIDRNLARNYTPRPTNTQRSAYP